MAKFHLDRLRQKYGFTGGSYRELMERIIANNTEAVSRAMGRKLVGTFTEAGKEFGKRDKRLFPQVDDVLPKRSVFTRKAAIDGTKITDTLKTRLDVDLRNSIRKYQNQGTLFRRRGPTATALNPEVIEDFQSRITQTFETYTQRDPRYNMPANVKTIAVTEVRSAVNEIKSLYTREFAKRNPDLVVEKVWRHNKRFSRDPRPSHMRANGQRVPFDEPFRLVENDGTVVLMQHPHDPQAPPEQIINCSCDWYTQVRRIA